MGLGPNPQKIPQNSGKKIRIPEGMLFNSPVTKNPKKQAIGEKLQNLFFRGEFTT